MAEAKLDTEVRREQIAEAAMNLIAAQGLRRMSIAAVARRVGLVPSGIYRHFKNKDEIIHAVLDRVSERLTENIEAALLGSDEPIEQLKDVMMRHIRFIREGRAIPRMVFADDAQTDNTRMKQHVVKVFSGYIGQVAEIVARGQSLGRIRSDVPPQTIAMMLFGIVMPAGIIWHMTDGGFDVTRHAQQSWRLFISAVTNNANTPARQQCDESFT